MKGLVIDVYNSEAYIDMPDGINVCVGLCHLPPNTKIGCKINVSSITTAVTNHKIANEVL